MENVPKLIGRLSMASHLDELAAAVRALTGLDWVDTQKIIGLGNSEGTLHVLHYAHSTQPVPLAGMILAAPPGRPIQDVLLSQLTLQSAQVPGGAEMMDKVAEAAARYSAGQPMNPDPALPESVRMVLSSFETPANLPLARELWNESATELLAPVTVPTLVLIGGRDVQIDQSADGGPLQQAARGNPNVAFAFPPNANHVFKQDLRTPEEMAATPGAGYNEDSTQLDPESLELMLDWLGRTIRA